MRKQHVYHGIGIAALALAAAACNDDDASRVAGPGRTTGPQDSSAAKVACVAGNGGITLPSGFCASVLADSVGNARHLFVATNGDTYVAIGDTTHAGGVLALRDTNGDGVADQKQYFGATNANAVVIANGGLYVAYNDRVVRYAMTAGTLVPTGTPATIVSGLPASGDHGRKNVTFDAGDAMYVNIGSASNACQVQNRQLHSPGVDPCPELSTRAGIWRFSATRTGQTQADGERFATGYRNTEALRYDPQAGALFGIPHGRDMLNDNWPELFSVQQGADQPSEEFLRIDRGTDAGWPYCYHDWQKRAKVLAPEYGGDGTTVGRCANLQMPLAAFPGHWAPNDLLFYTGTQFPAEYLNGVFVAFHGGHDRTPLPNEGYNVAFMARAGGVPQGTWRVFADGFNGGATTLPANATYRPMGLAMGADGSLYVSSDRGGRIWRIVYRTN